MEGRAREDSGAGVERDAGIPPKAPLQNCGAECQGSVPGWAAEAAAWEDTPMTGSPAFYASNLL